MSYAEVARGLADLAVFPLTGADVVGAIVDVPGARSLNWSTSADSDTIGGDDKILGVAYGAKSGSGSIEVAKANLTALAAMLGLTVTTTGVAPASVQSLEESSAANTAYVQIKGQAAGVDTTGSAFEVTIHKAKIGGIDETLEFEGWHTPSYDFEFVDNATGKMLTRKLMETKVAFA